MIFISVQGLLSTDNWWKILRSHRAIPRPAIAGHHVGCRDETRSLRSGTAVKNMQRVYFGIEDGDSA